MEVVFNTSIDDIKYKAEMVVSFTGGRIITFCIKDGNKEYAYFDLDVDELEKISEMVYEVGE
jgi:hypothetical protein